MLTRYGATRTMFADDNENGAAVIQFDANNRSVRFKLTLPSKKDRSFLYDGRKQLRRPEKMLEAWEQACRAKWRALVLCIKAKFEAVAAGISIFEDEFLAQIVVSRTETVSDVVRPQIAAAYQGGLPEGISGLLGVKS